MGPGNKYVTAAKLLVFGQVDIDSPAGPSEALILADDTAEARYVAVDFLSQVEHDPEAAAVLVTPDPDLARRVVEIIAAELPHLPRREIIAAALAKYSAVLLVSSLDEALEFANLYAPEHLQVVTRDPFALLPRIRNAGSIFLGPYAPVPVGDYASGTNHVLPTGGCARMFSGLSVDDFIQKPTFQHLTREALAVSERYGHHPGRARGLASARPGGGRKVSRGLDNRQPGRESASPTLVAPPAGTAGEDHYQ